MRCLWTTIPHQKKRPRSGRTLSHLRCSPKIISHRTPQAAHGSAALACGYITFTATPLIVRALPQNAAATPLGTQVSNLRSISRLRIVRLILLVPFGTQCRRCETVRHLSQKLLRLQFENEMIWLDRQAILRQNVGATGSRADTCLSRIEMYSHHAVVDQILNVSGSLDIAV